MPIPDGVSRRHAEGPQGQRAPAEGPTAKSKDAAVKKPDLMLPERDSIGMVLDRSTRVRDLATAWLADVADRSRPHTLANYRSHVRGNILPTLGDRIAADLTPADVRRMHAAMRRRGVRDATVAGAHRTLVSLLEHARSERIIAENIAALTPQRRTRPSKLRSSLTREEAKALLSLADARWTLALLTGLRSGEARALRWSDIDLAAGVAELVRDSQNTPASPGLHLPGVSGHGSPEASDPYRHVLTPEGRRAVESLSAWVDSE